jgi:hypothetical protein
MMQNFMEILNILDMSNDFADLLLCDSLHKTS